MNMYSFFLGIKENKDPGRGDILGFYINYM